MLGDDLGRSRIWWRQRACEGAALSGSVFVWEWERAGEVLSLPWVLPPLSNSWIIFMTHNIDILGP